MRTTSLAVVSTLACAVALAVVPLGVAQTGDPEGVVWAGVRHTSPESLEAWLKARGLSYDTWAYTHPIASLRLEQLAERREREREEPVGAIAPIASVAALDLGAAGMVAALAGGIALLAGAVALSAPQLRFHPSLRFASDRRVYLSLGGITMLAIALSSTVQS